MDKLSYALGMSLASSLLESGIRENLDIESCINGFKDIINNNETKITFNEANDIIQNYFKNISNKDKMSSDTNLEEGNIFLEQNKNRPEVTVLESGLQYEILTNGKGQKPKATDKIKCHYHGTLIDGTVFDSSVERNSPATFRVNQVIQGWVEALQLMSVGAKWKLFIPSHLAYGNQSAGQTIGPNSTLIFDVELLEIL